MNLPISRPRWTSGMKPRARIPSPTMTSLRRSSDGSVAASSIVIGCGSTASAVHGECPSTAARYSSESPARRGSASLPRREDEDRGAVGRGHGGAVDGDVRRPRRGSRPGATPPSARVWSARSWSYRRASVWSACPSSATAPSFRSRVTSNSGGARPRLRTPSSARSPAWFRRSSRAPPRRYQP